jgi:hypothetical protein
MEVLAELSQGKNHCTERIGGCVGIRAILDVAEWRKVSCPFRYSEPPIVQPVAIRYIVYASVSQPPGRGPVPGPGINYTGPWEVLLEFAILVF